MKYFGLRTRLTFLFVLIFGSTTILFSLYSYYKLNESLLQDFDNALFNYSIDISQTIEIGPKNDIDLPPLKVEEGKILPFSSGTALILVRHKSGKVLIKTGDFGDFLPPHKKEIERIRKGAEAEYATTYDVDKIPRAEASAYRIITFPLDSETKPTLFLQIAAPMSSYESQLKQFRSTLIFGIPPVIIIAILAGLYVASRALRPVQQMIQFANRISAHDLHERIPLPHARDEIHKLAETLNQMLERIEKSFASQERFVADASHQLLTPLTILRGEIEINQKIYGEKNPSDENTAKLFKSLVQEVDNLSRIVKDMLLLARIDSGQNSLQLSDVYIDEILIDVIARLQKLANSKKIQIKLDFHNLEKRNLVEGDPDLIANLLTNLIENAIKYSNSDELVHVVVDWSDDNTTLTIEDFGIGISDKILPQMFNRFSRGDSSSKTKGFGLGLAIAQKIAQLHQSEIIFIPKHTPGALVQLKLPHKKH